MKYPYTLPLFDAGMKQGTWNERMNDEEYAVHYSSFSEQDETGPYCTVLADLPSAITYAQQQVAERPALRCTIYDHHGLAGRPFREICGSTFKPPSELSPRFRRWAGSILFFGGLALTLFDWRQDFRLTWPGVVGSRMLIPGFVLLCIEGLILLQSKQDRRNNTQND